MSVPERETTPTGPGRYTSAGIMPTLHRPGTITPGPLGPTSTAPRREMRGGLRHVPYRDTLGDADDEVEAGVRRLDQRVASAAGRHEEHGDIRAGSLDRGGDGPEDGHAILRAPGLAGETPATIVVPAARMRAVWSAPSRPVMPCTRTRLCASTRIAISPPPGSSGGVRPRRRPRRRPRPRRPRTA